jgi:hypothetical protein
MPAIDEAGALVGDFEPGGRRQGAGSKTICTNGMWCSAVQVCTWSGKFSILLRGSTFSAGIGKVVEIYWSSGVSSHPLPFASRFVLHCIAFNCSPLRISCTLLFRLVTMGLDTSETTEGSLILYIFWSKTLYRSSVFVCTRIKEDWDHRRGWTWNMQFELQLVGSGEFCSGVDFV